MKIDPTEATLPCNHTANIGSIHPAVRLVADPLAASTQIPAEYPELFMAKYFGPLFVLSVIASSIFPIDGSGSQVSPDIAAKLSEIGRVIDPPKTASLYVGLHEKEPYSGVSFTRDVKYGVDDRNILDIAAEEPRSSLARPVLLFVHGGGFVAGNKRSNPTSPFYDNVMLFAARNGMVGVNMTYRLAPANPWPAGAQDVGAAVSWVRDNIAKFGGDPAHVVIVGHSSGAFHVASYLAHSEFQVRGSGVAGAVLVSGLYDLSIDTSATDRAYLGSDESKYAERSVLPGISRARVPIMLAWATLDPPRFAAQSENLKELLCTAGHRPEVVILKNHSHLSSVFAINTSDKSLTEPMLRFVRTLK
ncbi:MAG: alpha/beta hydrolase [Afipia sp.]